MWEGKGDWEEMHNYVEMGNWERAATKVMRRIRYRDGGKFTFKHPGREEMVTLTIEFTLSGDLVVAREEQGPKSRFNDATHVCNYCTASKKQLTALEGQKLDGKWWRKEKGSDGKEYLVYACPCQLRSYERSCHLSHNFAHEWETEFMCPACKVKFTEANTAQKKATYQSVTRRPSRLSRVTEVRLQTHLPCNPQVCMYDARKESSGRQPVS